MASLPNGLDTAEKKKMKVLYDFEAAEDNELSFQTGDIITILDDSDANWWKGEGANGIGLFPSNFVAPFVEEEKQENTTQNLKDSSNENVATNHPAEPVVVNEDLIDHTLHSLQSTDPETTTSDLPEVLQSEESCLAMGKLIDNELEDLDRQHLNLSHLNEKILESLKLYDRLMNQVPAYSHPSTNRPSGIASHASNHPHHLQRGVAPSYHPGPASFTPAVNPNYHPPLPSAYGPTAVGPTVRHNPVPAAQINQFH